jgi:hypothetical protein
MNIQAFCDAMLFRRASSSWSLKESLCLHLQGPRNLNTKAAPFTPWAVWKALYV